MLVQEFATVNHSRVWLYPRNVANSIRALYSIALVACDEPYNAWIHHYGAVDDDLRALGGDVEQQVRLQLREAVIAFLRQQTIDGIMLVFLAWAHGYALTIYSQNTAYDSAHANLPGHRVHSVVRHYPLPGSAPIEGQWHSRHGPSCTMRVTILSSP